MKINLPEINLKTVQTLGTLELKDELGRPVGQYFFGKGQGRTVFLFGKYKGPLKHTLNAKPSSMACLRLFPHHSPDFAWIRCQALSRQSLITCRSGPIRRRYT